MSHKSQESTTKQKKILFITHLYYPAVGGAERVFQRIAEGLAKRGHSVTVLTSDALSTEQYFQRLDNHLPDDQILNGVRIIRQPLKSSVYRVLRMMNPIRRFRRMSLLMGSLFFGPHFYEKFKMIWTQKNHLVIAGPTPTSTVFYGFLYSKHNRSTKFVVFPHLHISDKFHTSFPNIWALKRADIVLSLTKIEKKYLVGRGIKPENILRIVNGVDEYLLFPKKQIDPWRKDYVLYLGQEGEHKRIPLLLKAMSSIWERGYTNKLIIAGARTYYSATIDQMMQRLPKNVQSNIERLNDFEEEQKIRLLDNCRVLVNPSSYEAFGLVFLEAWARGKPVIGARIPALKEIISDGRNGYLFDPKKKEDLVDKILLVLENKKLADELGAQGKKEVQQKYIWKHIVEALETSLF